MKALDIKYRGVRFKAFLRSRTKDSAQWLVETLGGRHFSIRKLRAAKGSVFVSEDGVNPLIVERIGQQIDASGSCSYSMPSENERS